MYPCQFDCGCLLFTVRVNEPDYKTEDTEISWKSPLGNTVVLRFCPMHLKKGMKMTKFQLIKFIQSQLEYLLEVQEIRRKEKYKQKS